MPAIAKQSQGQMKPDLFRISHLFLVSLMVLGSNLGIFYLRRKGTNSPVGDKEWRVVSYGQIFMTREFWSTCLRGDLEDRWRPCQQSRSPHAPVTLHSWHKRWHHGFVAMWSRIASWEYHWHRRHRLRVFSNWTHWHDMTEAPPLQNPCQHYF